MNSRPSWSVTPRIRRRRRANRHERQSLTANPASRTLADTLVGNPSSQNRSSTGSRARSRPEERRVPAVSAYPDADRLRSRPSPGTSRWRERRSARRTTSLRAESRTPVLAERARRAAVRTTASPAVADRDQRSCTADATDGDPPTPTFRRSSIRPRCDPARAPTSSRTTRRRAAARSGGCGGPIRRGGVGMLKGGE